MMNQQKWTILNIWSAGDDVFAVKFAGASSAVNFSKSELEAGGIQTPPELAERREAMREALLTIGYSHDKIEDIAQSGAYWQDADPLVRACREATS